MMLYMSILVHSGWREGLRKSWGWSAQMTVAVAIAEVDGQTDQGPQAHQAPVVPVLPVQQHQAAEYAQGAGDGRPRHPEGARQFRAGAAQDQYADADRAECDQRTHRHEVAENIQRKNRRQPGDA